MTLPQADVEFVVIGGIALVLHGGLRTTEDLDIVPHPDPANLDCSASCFKRWMQLCCSTVRDASARRKRNC